MRATREAAIDRLIEALEAFDIEGSSTTSRRCSRSCAPSRSAQGDVHTGLIPEVLRSKKEADVSHGRSRAHRRSAARRAARRSTKRAGKQLLAGFGIAVPKSLVVHERRRRGAALAALKPPFAVKVMSPDILHKSDAGGVKIGLAASQTIVGRRSTRWRRCRRSQRARVDGFLIEEMAPPGQEIVVGGVRDPHFGPLVMVGLGGIFVEVLADVAFRICPDHAARCRRNARRAERRGHTRGRARAQAGVARGDRRRAAENRRRGRAPHAARGGHHGSRHQSADRVRAGGRRRRCAVHPDRIGARHDHASDISSASRRCSRRRPCAVIGASRQRHDAAAMSSSARMREFGFAGTIYPIHPTADDDRRAARVSAASATRREPVDYAYIAVSGAQIPPHARGRARTRALRASDLERLRRSR